MDKTGVRRISLIAGSTSSCSFRRRIEAGCKLMEAGYKPDTSRMQAGRNRTYLVHLCRIQRIAYGKSQKAIISPRRGLRCASASKLTVCPISSRTWPGRAWPAAFTDLRWTT
jgi:hypothetical protein